jgi:hypothetical protein
MGPDDPFAESGSRPVHPIDREPTMSTSAPRRPTVRRVVVLAVTAAFGAVLGSLHAVTAER